MRNIHKTRVSVKSVCINNHIKEILTVLLNNDLWFVEYLIKVN